MKKSEEIVGETPNGGIKSIAYFFDEEGNPTTKDKAQNIRIVELDKDNNRVNEAYLHKA